MDLNDYWQENKRFVTTVAAGATVFLVGYLILSGRYEERIGAQKSQERTLRSELGGELFSIEDLETAEDQNEALDVIETVVLLAIQAGARNLDKINVRLDPNLSTRQGVGSVETTRITFHFDGPALPLTQVLKNSQRPPDGRPLLVDEVAMVALAAKPGEARLEFTVAVARLHDVDGEDED